MRQNVFELSLFATSLWSNRPLDLKKPRKCHRIFFFVTKIPLVAEAVKALPYRLSWHKLSNVLLSNIPFRARICKRWRSLGSLKVYKFGLNSMRYRVSVSKRDEGILKTPIPKCRLYWSFCLCWWSNCVGSESGQKECETPAEYGLQHNSTPPTPTATHYLCILYI